MKNRIWGLSLNVAILWFSWKQWMRNKIKNDFVGFARKVWMRKSTTPILYKGLITLSFDNYKNNKNKYLNIVDPAFYSAYIPLMERIIK